MGKRTRNFLFVLLGLLFLTGCAESTSTEVGEAALAHLATGYSETSDPATAEVNEEAETLHTLDAVAYLDGGYDILQDSKTGCMYVEYTNGTLYGITPYYDGRGKVAGCFASEEDYRAKVEAGLEGFQAKIDGELEGES